ncbi:unnamed protein product [Brachionus calyciflorus]|uniref:Apple domain-containing protein n=1 Tax=Brachionus calyciflorus TaxID=104777 RepID=A0A813UMR3_9BILA|nr:unnamed protein product [Brachionus calyciflorus]
MKKLLLFISIFSLTSSKIVIHSGKYKIYKNFSLYGSLLVYFAWEKQLDLNDCLKKCNLIKKCTTISFKTNSDLSFSCSLYAYPHILTNLLIPSSVVTIYNKITEPNSVFIVNVNTNPLYVLFYWNFELKYFLVEYLTDSKPTWKKAETFAISNNYRPNSTFSSKSASDEDSCKNYCINETNCNHFVFFISQSLCELRNQISNSESELLSPCPANAVCKTLVSNYNTYPQFYIHQVDWRSGYRGRIAFYSNENRSWSNWFY